MPKEVRYLPSIPPNASLLEAALRYVQHGFAVVPTKGGKHAGSILGKGWPEKSLRTRDDVLREFSHAQDDWCLGLHMGPSGTIALDVDAPEQLGELGDLLDATGAPFQHTRQGTGNQLHDEQRGHWLFRVPEGVSFANASYPWGDVRCGNAIIIVEPSKHPKAAEGGCYQWAWTGEIPELPGEIAALLKQQGTRELVPVGSVDVTAFLAAVLSDQRRYGLHDQHDFCTEVRAELFGALPAIGVEGQRHNTMRDTVLRLISLAADGHIGVGRALEKLRDEYLAVQDEDPEADFRSAVTSAAEKIVAATGAKLPNQLDSCHLVDPEFYPEARGGGFRQMSVIDARVRRDGGEPSPAEMLLEAVMQNYQLVTAAGEVYLVPFEQRDGLGVVGVAQTVNSALRPRLAALALQLGIGNKIGRGTLDKIIDQLCGLELLRPNGDDIEIHLRFAETDERLVIDMGDRTGSRIEVRDDGWKVTEAEPAPVFRRSRIMKPLPEPEAGGSLHELAEVLALDPDGREFKLLLGWLLSLPFASSVRPGLLLVGPPGSGKSTRIRLLASIFEPMDMAGLGANFGRNHDDDLVRASHRSIPLWDNLTGVSGESSDLLCSLITGGGRERRRLYSDDGLTSMAVRRPVGLTAVGRPAGLRADAMDRLITVELDAPAERLSDDELQRRFNEAHPRLLGAVLDALAAILRYRASVAAPSVRMLGFAGLLAAFDRAAENGDIIGPSGLLAAYVEHISQVKSETASDDIFGGALIDLLDRRGGHWRGHASQLLNDCLEMLPLAEREEVRRSPGWPRSPRSVPPVLAHLRDPLAELGIRFETKRARANKTEYFFHRE